MFNIFSGTFKDRKTGLIMPKIIRLVRQDELIERCVEYLKVHGKVAPSRSYFQKLLQVLPSASLKMMRGINPSKGPFINYAEDF